MNKRIKKKKFMNALSSRKQRSEVILEDVIYAYSYAAVTGGMTKGYIRWRTFLKAMDLRKRDCSIWRDHL